MKFFKKKKMYIFVLVMIIVLLYNSYKKTLLKEGVVSGTKDINDKFRDIDEKYNKLVLIISMLQTDIQLIKETVNYYL